jgi:hypothetical protein
VAVKQAGLYRSAARDTCVCATTQPCIARVHLPACVIAFKAVPTPAFCILAVVMHVKVTHACHHMHAMHSSRISDSCQPAA